MFRYVKLTKNYRSHAAILHYPNVRFYDDELEVYGSPESINAFLGSPQLVSPEFPVVFHAISGRNERESTSPSYFNIDEATEVLENIKTLLNDRRHPIRQWPYLRMTLPVDIAHRPRGDRRHCALLCASAKDSSPSPPRASSR